MIFGNTTAESVDHSVGTNVVAVGRYQLVVDGLISKLTTYIEDVISTPNLKGVIYSDNAGVPDLLLAVTPAVACPTSPAWQDLVFSTPIKLAANYYWLGIVADADFVQFKRAASGGTGYSKTDSYASPTSPWSGGSSNSNKYSIYATYDSQLTFKANRLKPRPFAPGQRKYRNNVIDF